MECGGARGEESAAGAGELSDGGEQLGVGDLRLGLSVR
jgi:hypothetical protein